MVVSWFVDDDKDELYELGCLEDGSNEWIIGVCTVGGYGGSQ